ncbi:hypothetical protein ABIF60_003034 [Bradyrhizobium japonicum]
MVRLTLTVALPPPTDVVRPRDLSRSALPVTLRSAPVELFSVTAPAPTLEAVWLKLVASVAAPAVMDAVLTPLARSTAVNRSLTVAAGVPAVPR